MSLNSRASIWVILLMVLFTVSVYSSSLRNSFIWDDHLLIANNGFIKSWENFPRFLNRSYLTKVSDVDYLGKRDIGSGESSYRPVGTLTYFIDYSIWKLNPFGYHLTNLFLHITNVILFFFFISFIADSRKIGLLASFLFALHPVNAEAVNVVALRPNLLFFCFFLASFMLFIKSRGYTGIKKVYIYILSLVSFFLALFSKETAMILPLVLLSYDYLLNKKTKNTLAHFKNYYYGYLVVLFFYIIIRFFVISSVINPLIAYPMRDISVNLFTMSRVLGIYVQWLLLPVNIHSTLPDDPRLISYSLFDIRVVFSLVLIALIIFTALKLRKRLPLVTFGIFWFFIGLIPVSNIICPLTNYIAPRYLYLSAAGFCLILSFLIVKLTYPKFLNILAMMIVVFYAIFTFMGTLYYKNSIIFWRDMADNYPANALAHSSLAASYFQRGLLDEAIKEYKIAVSLDKGYAKDHNELGKCYFNKGMYAEAIKEFKTALDLDPNFYKAWNNLASALGQSGRYIDAIKCYEKAIELNKEYPEAYNGLGVTYAKMNNYDEARKMWQKALTIDSANQTAADYLRKLPKQIK